VRATGGPARLIAPPSYARVAGLDAGDLLHNAFAVRGPRIDAEGEVSPHRGHLRPLLPHSSSASRFTEARARQQAASLRCGPLRLGSVAAVH
jgi:hypothetical protein